MEEKSVTLEEATNIAIAHMQQKNYRVAEMVLQDILKAEPDEANAHYLLSLAQYFMGSTKSALKHIEQAVKHEEAQAEWWCNYGIMLTETGAFDKAIDAYDNGIEVDSSYDMSYWNKSHCHWLAGAYEDAEKEARKAIELNPATVEAWLNLGAAVVKQGRKEEAVECWEKALEINPDFVFAWNNIGNALRDMGRLEDSIQKCRKALELDPHYPEAMNNLANALMDTEHLKEAEEYYQKTIAIKPDYIEAHNNLAICLIKQGRFEEAIQEARVALSYRHDYFESLLSLGLAYKAIGDFDEAEKAIQQATLIKPDSAEVHVDLADLLFMKDCYNEAEIELEKARQLKDDSPRLYLKLADVLERGNKVEDALNAVSKAVELNPEMPEAYLKKGNICHVANRIEDAKDSLKTALNMNPEAVNALLSLAELHLSIGEQDIAEGYIHDAQKLAPNAPALFLTLSKVKKFTEDDPDFQNMVALEKDVEKLGIEQASALNYALFTAYEHIGNYDAAFTHLMKGNNYKRRMVPYDSDQQAQSFKNITEIYSKDMLNSFAGKGFDSDVPVFILGMPRSGTTLTEQIISSHANVFGAGELMEISMLETQFGMITPENAEKQGQWYVEQVKKRDQSGDAKHITDKMPGNFSSLGKIVSILPNAKIIHTRRNPIDTCLSCFKQNFARGQYWSYDLKELGEYYNNYLDLMAYWRAVLGDRFIEIDYEETVGQFEDQARHLIDYVGLPWDDACLEPHKQKRAVLTASKMQVTKPVYKTSVKAWERYEKQLEPLIEELRSGAAAALLDD